MDRLSLALLRGRTLTLQNSRSRHAKRIVEGEFFTADVESIEGVGAVGAMFEQVFLALGKFLTGFVFLEAVATVGDTG